MSIGEMVEPRKRCFTEMEQSRGSGIDRGIYISVRCSDWSTSD